MGQNLDLDLAYWREKENQLSSHLKILQMQKFYLLAGCFVFCLLITSCITTRKVNSFGQVEYVRHDGISIGKGAKKRKIHSLTYPPADFTKGLIDFHKKFNQWPKSINDLTAFSFDAMNAVNRMYQKSYEKLDVTSYTPDSIVISYLYNPMLSRDEDPEAGIFLDRKFPGKYIYIASKGDFLVENSPDKMRRGRK